MLAIQDFLPELSKEQLKETKLLWECPSCNCENTLVVEVQTRYVEMFGYPFIPVRKELNVKCSNCGYQSSLETLPDNLKQLCISILKSSKIPIHQYKVLIYLTAILSLFFLWIYFQEPGFVDLLKNPKTGDIYLTNSGISLKGYAMVSAVEQGFVYLTFHKEKPEYLINELRTYKVIEIADVVTPYSKEQLYQLYKDGFILDVERRDLPDGVRMYQKKIPDYKNEAKDVAPRKASDGKKVNKAVPANEK
jgi:hypothetical protein